MMHRRLNEDRRLRASLLPSMAINVRRLFEQTKRLAPHAASVCFFRSNQLWTFAMMKTSAKAGTCA